MSLIHFKLTITPALNPNKKPILAKRSVRRSAVPASAIGIYLAQSSQIIWPTSTAKFRMKVKPQEIINNRICLRRREMLPTMTTDKL